MIEIDNITIQYSTEVPIKNFSFQVKMGEKCVLIGDSGSGKSTLLNALLGFVPLQNGTITIDKIPLIPQNIALIRNKMAWLPQELNFDFTTVKELLYYPFTFKQNRDLQPTREETILLMEQLLLEDNLLEKRLSEISGGQKQRIALASIFLLKKPLLLLDEPTAALDNQATNAICQYISQLPATAIISSHDNRLFDCFEKHIILHKNHLL